MLVSGFLIILGVVMLYAGGELLVACAKALALRFGVSPLVIGLTIVAFATSCPELAATMTAALRGSTEMALGNVIGSNIANIGLILGTAALIFPLATSARFLRREVAFMMLATVMLYPFLITGTLERWHALIFLAALTFFLVTLLREPDANMEQTAEEVAEMQAAMSVVRASIGVALGVLVLAGGAQALVAGASNIARAFGIGDRVIGLTLVAIGTSLPELATSIVAARRRESEMILGNIIGSNIFNLLFILGMTALVKPLAVAPAVVALDFWMLLATSITLFVLLATREKLTRIEGGALLVGYALYMVFLFR